MSFQARFPGRCGACDEQINVGDPVRYDGDYRGELIHARCERAVDEFVPSRTERRCPDCWTWHAGECA